MSRCVVERIVLMVIAPSTAEHSEVRLVGDLEFATNLPLALFLRRAVDAGVCGVVMEMSQVTFMDCSTVHVLARAARRFEARGRRLVVARPSSSAGLVLGLTGYDVTWPVTDDLCRAVDLVRASGGEPPDRQQPDERG